MKKIISFMLALVMIFSTTAFAADFKDTTNVPQSDAIDIVETLGIVNGYGNDAYGPNDTLTRAQLCTMLTRALYGNPIYVSTVQFTDVPAGYWASAYINTAYAYGLMEGYGAGKFGPEDEITYTQMAAVIMKALGYDCGKLAWPAGVNAMAHTLNLFDNIEFKNYNDGCTRAHAAQIIYNAFDLNYVNHKADYPVTLKNKTFLVDGLGFNAITCVVDGHRYQAYMDIETGKTFVTNNCLSYEVDIYVVNGNTYRFKNSSKNYDINWSKVSLFINGVEITKTPAAYLGAYTRVVGVFDEADNLIAIQAESLGKDYVYAIASDAVIIESIVNLKHLPTNLEDVVLTHFAETGEYIISTDVFYGWVSEAYKSVIYVDGVAVSWKNTSFAKNDFVKVYYNYRDEVVYIEKIADPYRYDVTDGFYHTAECKHVKDNVDCVIKTYAELENGTYTFKECPHCHANEGTVKITKN